MSDQAPPRYAASKRDPILAAKADGVYVMYHDWLVENDLRQLAEARVAALENEKVKLTMAFRAAGYLSDDLVAGVKNLRALFDSAREDPDEPPDFQDRVREWAIECFGEVVFNNGVERNFRFLEEALELVQALGCSKEHAFQLVEYVYGRPLGEPDQEVGGVMVTLAALCSAWHIHLDFASEAELARVWEKIDVIREKQARKLKDTALPGSAT